MGEMLVLLGAADVCFMGGSLVGDKVGGHNVLEPAALGVPVIIGPSYYNFKEITEELLAENCISVNTADTLPTSLGELFDDPDHREKLITNASKVVKRNQGSLQHTMNSVLEIH